MGREEFELSNGSPAPCDCCIAKGVTLDVGPHSVAPLVTLVAVIAFREISIAKRCEETFALVDQRVDGIL